AARVGRRCRVGDVPERVGVSGLQERVAGRVGGQLVGEQAAGVVAVGAVLAGDAAVHRVAVAVVAVPLHVGGVAIELPLQPVIDPVAVLVGDQLDVLPVAGVAVVDG